MKLPKILLASIGLLSVSAFGDDAEVPQLSASEVELIMAQAATRAEQISRNSIISVTDREGFVLGIWDVSGKRPIRLPNFDITNLAVVKQYSLIAGAITRASTAAFLSSDENAFTSRTAGFIIQQHFPPGIQNTPNGPLVGVGLSSLFFSDVNRVKVFGDNFDGATPVGPTISPGVRADLFPLTSLNDSPGGLPLYKGNKLVGGIGVTGDGSPSDLTPAGALFFGQVPRNATFTFKTGRDKDEDVALAGQTNFRPRKEILGSNVLINGIRVPYVYERTEDFEDLHDARPLQTIGHRIDVPLISTGFKQVATGNPRSAPAQYPYEVRNLGGVRGEVRFPFRDDPSPTKIGKADRLSAVNVEEIISKVADRANQTRAGIRLPIGTTMKIFITVVSNPNKAGAIPQILGVFRTGEATVFSWDVAVQKARTSIFFSNKQLAMSSRAVGFLSQRFYPPGLDGRQHGPLFGFQEAVSLRTNPNPPPGPFFPNNPFLPTVITPAPLRLGFPGDLNVPNGITIFPGGFPLYKEGMLVGAVGVSGDGVDQDDIASSSGTVRNLPKPAIRSDHYTYRGARLPYVKFPRDPEQ